MRRQTTPEVGNPFEDIPNIADHRAEPTEPVTRERSYDTSPLAQGLKDGSLTGTTTAVGQATQGMSHREIAENARRMLGEIGGVRERRDPNADKYHPFIHGGSWQSAEAAEVYDGVGEDRHIIWPTKAGANENSDMALNKLFYSIPEAKYVTRKSDGKRLEDMDVVAVSIPMKYKHMLTVEESDQYEGWEDLNDQETVIHSDGFGRGVRKPIPDKAAKEAEAHYVYEQAMERSRQLGVGNNTPIFGEGLPGYRKALATIPQSERDQMEFDARMGGQHVEFDPNDLRKFGTPVDEDRGGRQQFGGFRGTPEYNKWMTEADKKYRQKFESGATK